MHAAIKGKTKQERKQNKKKNDRKVNICVFSSLKFWGHVTQFLFFIWSECVWLCTECLHLHQMSLESNIFFAAGKTKNLPLKI